MGMDNVNLAALIGSRICHDLISPIGAINNGLELLDMEGNTQGPELNLISESVGNAGARIRFFRIAYGAPSDRILNRGEVTSLLRDLNAAGRFQVDWELAEDLPRDQVRLIFLALQCCETAMPYGGTVRVENSGGTWVLTAQTQKLSLDEALWSALAAGDAPSSVTPAQVQFALLPSAARSLGLDIALTQGETGLTLRF